MMNQTPGFMVNLMTTEWTLSGSLAADLTIFREITERMLVDTKDRRVEIFLQTGRKKLIISSLWPR
jgi:hypothetical protein